MPAKPTTVASNRDFSPEAIDLSAVTAFARACRPMINSAISAGYAKRKARIRYVKRKAAPPLEAAFVGNPQIFPSPTAEPEAAIKKPNLELNSPRAAAITFLYYSCVVVIAS